MFCNSIDFLCRFHVFLYLNLLNFVKITKLTTVNFFNSWYSLQCFDSYGHSLYLWFILSILRFSVDIYYPTLLSMAVDKVVCNILVCTHTTATHTTYASTLMEKEVFLSEHASSRGFESRLWVTDWTGPMTRILSLTVQILMVNEIETYCTEFFSLSHKSSAVQSQCKRTFRGL